MVASLPQRSWRAGDTIELWHPRNSPHFVDWRRVDAVSERRLSEPAVEVHPGRHQPVPPRRGPSHRAQRAALGRLQRARTWWHAVCRDDHNWGWRVAADTFQAAVRRALHGAALIDTTVRVAREGILHECLTANVDATPPNRL